MKLLFIIHNQVDTGPFQKVMEMCRYLVKEGVEIDLICTSKSNRFRIKKNIIDGVNLLQFPDLLFGKLRQGLDLWNTFRRTFYLRSKVYDLIHIIDCRPVVIFPALFSKFIKKIPLVISWWDWFGKGGTSLERSGIFYSMTFGNVETFFEERFRRFADYATTITYTLKKRLKGLGFPENKIKVIRVGSDSGIISYDKIAVRKRLGINENALVFVYSGTMFDNDKELLIQSLRCLNKRVNKLPLTVLVGNHNFEEGLIEELNIILTGRLENIEDVYTYLQVSDFALLPMRVSVANKARWPSKISDYLCAGLPLLTTAVSDFEEIFVDYQLGFMAKNDSAEEFAGVLHEAMNCGEDDMNNIKKDINEFVEKNLRWEWIAKEIMGVYEEVLM